MRIRRYLGLCLTLLACLPALAAAQDTRKVGLTIGYPAAVGILWHATDKIALRPELSLSGSSSSTQVSSVNIDSSAWALGVGFSALFYTGKYDHLRTYFTPRYSYTRASSTVTPTSTIQGTVADSTSTSNTHGFTGSFGAQYEISDRFSVFGELGFGFAHTNSRSDIGTTGHANAWGLRSGVGVVVYF